jgi:hypothetical protein
VLSCVAQKRRQHHHILIVVATLGINPQEIYFINLESQGTKGIGIRYFCFALSDPLMLQLHYLLGFNHYLHMQHISVV